MTDPILGPDTSIRRLRTLYRALGDTTRLRIIGLLAELGPMPVTALSNSVALSQPLISWHLRILRLAGFIDTRRQGREVICRLRAAAFEELRAAEAQLLSGRGQPEAGAPGRGTLSPRAEEVPDVG